MIAVDTNILVYAHRRDSQWHAPAVAAVRELAEGPEPWLIAWPCLHEFLAVVTHPRVYRPPSTMEQALEQVSQWLESPSLVVAGEQDAHWPTLAVALRQTKLVGPAVHDARVAVICATMNVAELWSVDRDFTRFSAIRVRNPLIG